MVSRTKPVHVGLAAVAPIDDQLGADLIASLRKLLPSAVFAGVGGEAMRKAGVDTWHDTAEIAVSGITEALTNFPRLLKLRKALAKRLLEWEPQVFIGIGSASFTLNLERDVKKSGRRTVHYAGLPILASRESHARKLLECADRVLCLFSTEPPVYKKLGVDAQFVGHPLAWAFSMAPDQAAARAALGLPSKGPIIAIVPDTQFDEFPRLAAIFVAAAIHLRRLTPGLHFIASVADQRLRAAFEKVLRDPPNTKIDPSANPPSVDEWKSFRQVLTIVDGHLHEAMVASDLIVVSSNSALNGMLAKRPLVVAQQVSGLNYALQKMLGLITSPRNSLPNILAAENLVPELTQANCTPDHISEALRDWLKNPSRTTKTIARFKTIHAQLMADKDAAAKSIVQLISASAERVG